jgi:hypothetical protein
VYLLARLRGAPTHGQQQLEPPGAAFTNVHNWVKMNGRLCLKTDEVRDQRAQRRNKKELRALADRISTYGRNVHQRYPTGDVVVSERDLAEQLRKRPDSIATALDLLWANKKVQRAP